MYLQLITAKDLYIQNITVAEHNSGHSDSFQVKFANVFTNYPLGTVRVEDQTFKYKGRSIIIKRTKEMGVNRLNSVYKATNLKKIKSGNK